MYFGIKHQHIQFTKILSDIPQCLIIGETGIDKSGFFNKMGGIHYKLVWKQKKIQERNRIKLFVKKDKKRYLEVDLISMILTQLLPVHR